MVRDGFKGWGSSDGIAEEAWPSSLGAAVEALL